MIAYGQVPSEQNQDVDGPVYASTFGLATVSGNGEFVVPLPVSHLRTTPGLWIFIPQGQYPADSTCSAAVITEDLGPLDFDVAVTVEPELNSGALPEAGTVEALAATVEPNSDWATEPMAALALLAASEDVPVDQVFLDPGQGIDRLEIRNLDSCVIVIVHQGLGGTWQARGCTNGELDDLHSGERVVDDTWLVTAQGPPEYVAAIEKFRFLGGVDPQDAPLISAEMAAAWFGYEFEAPDRTEDGGGNSEGEGWSTLATYDWQGQTVTLQFDPGQEYCCVIYEATADNFNSGSQGTACRDWMTALHDDGARGFIVVVVHDDRTATVTIDSEPQEIPLMPTSVDHLRAAVVDAPFDFGILRDYLSTVSVLEPDGSPSPCIQE